MNAQKNPKIKMSDQVVPIHRIHLNPINPRHDPLDGDAEVIAELCKKELIGSLAKDIATMGALSPLELLGVVPMEGNPGHFVCVEGNRRTCALLLLHDPSRAPTAELQTLIKRIKINANIPKLIRVYVFPDFEAAKPWMDRRHLGDQDGVGTREWDTSQKTRASGSNTRTTAKANLLALAVVDHLSSKNLINKSVREKINLTTLSRYLSTPGLRAILGLASAKELKYSHDAAEVEKVLLQLITDSITKQADGTFRVNSRSNSEERLKYGHQLKSLGIAPTTLLKEAIYPDTDKHESEDTPSNQKSARDPSKRRYLFQAGDLVLDSKDDKVLLRLRKESLEIDLEYFPFGGNYLLRALVERIMIKFLKARKRYQSNMKNEQLTHVCLNELENLDVDSAILSVVKKAAGGRDQPYSLHSLGHAVHCGSVPSRKHLLAMADTWQPALQEMIRHF